MNRHERRAVMKQGDGGGRLMGHPNGLAQQSYRLAVEHFRAGNLGEAERLYRQTLAIDPKHVQSVHELGVIAMQEGRFDSAISAFIRVISLDSRIPEAHNNLSLALQKQGRFAAAVASSLRALGLRPGFAEAHNTLGLALQQMNRHDEAIAHFERALTVGQFAHVQQNLANSLRELGRYGEAIACFEAALFRNPLSADLHRNLGTVLLTLGQIEAACAEFQRAIELDPRQPASFRRLAEARRMTPHDPWLARMERLAAEIDGLAPDDQIELHFALGKALADAGEHTRSFRHYLAGNALRRSRTVYDEAVTLGSSERIRTGVTSTFLARHQGAGEPSNVPIFIVGMPRSGTTLVEQVLASHPRVAAAGERGDFASAIKRLPGADGTLDSFLEHLDELRPEHCRDLGAAYLAAIRPTALTAERITDKMPANFRLVGIIRAALPNARIIHMRRDPVDTCLSCFSQLFDGQQSFAYDLGELGRYWRAYDRLMAHWRDILPEGVMLEVQYEDLVREFEPEARRIVAYCGLEWHPACLTFYQTERPVTTASWVQVRQPIYRSSVGRWRPDDAVLRPLLDALQR